MPGNADNDGNKIGAYGIQKKLSEVRQPAVILPGSFYSVAELLMDAHAPFYSYSGRFSGGE